MMNDMDNTFKQKKNNSSQLCNMIKGNNISRREQLCKYKIDDDSDEEDSELELKNNATITKMDEITSIINDANKLNISSAYDNKLDKHKAMINYYKVSGDEEENDSEEEIKFTNNNSKNNIKIDSDNDSDDDFPTVRKKPSYTQPDVELLNNIETVYEMVIIRFKKKILTHIKFVEFN